MRKHWREFGFLGFVLAGLLLAILRPFAPALDTLGHLALGGMLLCTGLWILEPFGISVGVGSCLLFAAMLAAGVPARIVFSGFTQSAVWTMIPALFFGFALQKTGLGKRIAYALLKCIRHITYPSLILAWALIGIVLSILTPSITVRVVIAIPLAQSCVDLCGLQKGSRERSLLLLSAWAMMVVPGIGWASGSLLGPVLTGIFGSVESIPEITFTDWYRVALLPTTIVTVLLLLFGALFLRPKQPLHLSRDAFAAAYADLPRMSRKEKVTLCVLFGCFGLLATGNLHGIPDAAICLAGFVLLCATGVIERTDIGTGISWDIVLFVGASMSIGEIFSYTGVSAWLTKALTPVFSQVQTPWLLIVLLLVLLFVWRFVDVALLTPTIVVLAPVLPQLWETHGIHPIVWIPVFAFAICAFFLRYQNMFLLIGESHLKENGWTDAHRFRYALAYFLACVVAVLVSIPYWSALGWITH